MYRRPGMVKPTAAQARVEELFPALALWVRDGHIEVGDQEGFGFLTRALEYGGLAFEDDQPDTLAEALAVLEKGVREWYEEQGIEVGQRFTRPSLLRCRSRSGESPLRSS